MKSFVNIKKSIVSELLHRANREYNVGNEKFYAVKNKILSIGSTVLGFDVQFIEGKKCYSCSGTGIYKRYVYNGRVYDTDSCWHCIGGWYKRPQWNILMKVKYGNHVFHQPIARHHSEPNLKEFKLTGGTMIDGYISHSSAKYGKICRSILFLLYDLEWWKHIQKAYFSNLGKSYRIKWFYSLHNFINNLIYSIRYAYNFKLRRDNDIDDLPF